MTNRLRGVFWLCVQASQLYQSVNYTSQTCVLHSAETRTSTILSRARYSYSTCRQVNSMGRVQQPKSKPARKGSHSLLKGPRTDELKKSKTGKLTSIKNKIRGVERLLRKVYIGKVF